MKETRTVDTVLGPAEVHVFICDTCAKVVPACPTGYTTPTNWYRVELGYDTSRPVPSTIERWGDYCCVDCMLRHFAPDMYDPSSLLAKDSIEKIQKIRMDLEQAR